MGGRVVLVVVIGAHVFTQVISIPSLSSSMVKVLGHLITLTHTLALTGVLGRKPLKYPLLGRKHPLALRYRLNLQHYGAGGLKPGTRLAILAGGFFRI